MDLKTVTRGRTWSWGYPASVAAHALVLGLVVFGLPGPAFEPAPDEVVEVAVVPPPEEEPPAPPEPEPEEAPAPEPEEAEPTQAPAEPLASASAESADAAEASRIAALRPVVQFGETDAGPREAQDGNAATEEPMQASEPDAALPEASTEQDALPPADSSVTAEPPQELALPNGSAIPIPTPAPRAAAEPVAAKRLLSPAATGVLTATTAIGALPRGRRAGELCATELREQLRYGTPAYRPELLPTYELDAGTVLEVRQSAFRTNSNWFNLSFTCEVDGGATRVVSFALSVGEPVPRSEWRSRGFPQL
jgi:hypothetical protein